jgi:hypothetical protein
MEKGLETTEANQNRMKEIVAFVRITVLTIIALLLFSTVIYGAQNSIFGEDTVVSAQDTLSEAPERLYDVDLLYAYFQPGVSSGTAVLNFTRTSNITLPSGSSISEIYSVLVFSDRKRVSEIDKIGGTIGNGRIDGKIMMDLAMSGTFSARGNIGGLEPLKISFLNIHPALNEPLSLNLVRVCWITVNGNSTEVEYFNNETIKTAEPAKYQDGFLYNNLLPQEKLSSIDLFNPLKSPSSASSPTATSNPSSTPTPSVPEFSWLVVLPMFALMLFIAIKLKTMSRNLDWIKSMFSQETFTKTLYYSNTPMHTNRYAK